MHVSIAPEIYTIAGNNICHCEHFLVDAALVDAL